MHIVRDFPQARLNSEINARFLLNEDGDHYILLHNNHKNNDQANALVHVVLYGVIFSHMKFYMALFHMLQTFYQSSFLPSFTLMNYASSYRKM